MSAARAVSDAVRNRMDRFIDGIEWLAAIFVGIVAADIFISVLLRNFFTTSIPDSYDFGTAARHPDLLGHRRHQLPRQPHHGRPGLDRGGPAREAADRHLRHAGAAVRGRVQTAMLFDKVRLTYVDNVLTYDLSIPTWPFMQWPGSATCPPCC